MTRIRVYDSITLAGPDDAGSVVVCGSHGGVNAALSAAAPGARAAIFNDAGVGKEGAGVAGLAAVERWGMAAAAVAGSSARIGDGQDTYDSGVVTHANRWAAAAGVEPGIGAARAADLLAAWS